MSLNHLLKHSSLVDFLTSDITDFEGAESEGFEGRILDELRVVDIQTCEDRLSQRVTFQPSYLTRERERSSLNMYIIACIVQKLPKPKQIFFCKVQLNPYANTVRY